ncbi:glycosyl transferase [Roseomonas arctica]|uniref:peptidoglycan glycosyltransferase n=1 Tax=Plastoroseomonas arctica TaxID=1509237 RepID=A0AAF1KI08_9PROT|nr:glycosyl transferase [Plastoroseomonas arctica]
MLTDRHGAFLTQLGHEREVRGFGRMAEYGYWPVTPPERVARAMLALEDQRFAYHPGIDPAAVLRAAWNNLTGAGRRSGASTIAMQVARMQDPGPRHLWAKAVEAGTAIALTLRYGREAVLAQYLRLVPYGNGSHGIGHAARYYFDKPAGDLSWAEIALLSAIPQAPALHNPRHAEGLARAVARGHRALALLAAQGAIGPEEHATAAAQLAAFVLPAQPLRPDALHLVLRLREIVDRVGIAGLDPGDARLRTTVDLGLQARVARLAEARLDALRPAGAQQVAVLVVARGTREVLASLGSAGYAATPGGAFDYSVASRSPGSTLKPFLYALALQRGVLRPDEIMADLPDRSLGIGNADGGFLGPLLPRQALANSRNIPAANLLRRIGLESAFQQLRELGLHDSEVPAAHFGLSMAVGSLPTGLDRLVRAYGALAEDGVLGELVWYHGQRVAPPRRLMPQSAARQVTLFLADPQARLPSFQRHGTTEYPFAVALKTGTSQGYRDAWIVAWSDAFLVGVWVGRADAGPMLGVTGGQAAGAIAQAILLDLHGTSADALVAGGFAAPDGTAPVALCARTGRPDDGACGPTLLEWLPAEDALGARAEFDLTPPGDVELRASPVQRLSVVSPEHNSRFWRNPEALPRLNRITLRAAVRLAVPQVVWHVDGEPFAITDPGEPVYWPMTPGIHQFQLRLPSGETASRQVRIVVE